jgi:inositol-polyphosphate multikinase
MLTFYSKGLTSNASGTILTKPCTAAEIAFYESAASDPAHEAFYAHMPTFIGALRPASSDQQASLSKALTETDGIGDADATATVSAPPSKPDKEESGPKKEGWTPSGGAKLSTGLAICLSNTASGMRQPCVLDLKLGARLWDDDAPAAKRAKLDDVAASSTSGSLGFRVAGMKVYRGASAKQNPLAPEEEGFVEVSDNGYKTYDKFYGRQFKGEEDVRKAFEAYLPLTGAAAGTNSADFRNEIARRFMRELESVVFVLQNEESRMYSASLLFVYEGDEDAFRQALQYEKTRDAAEAAQQADDEAEGVEVEGEGGELDENDEPIEPKIADLSIIDFAHARWAKGEGADENALRGVRNALRILRGVADLR